MSDSGNDKLKAFSWLRRDPMGLAYKTLGVVREKHRPNDLKELVAPENSLFLELFLDWAKGKTGVPKPDLMRGLIRYMAARGKPPSEDDEMPEGFRTEDGLGAAYVKKALETVDRKYAEFREGSLTKLRTVVAEALQEGDTKKFREAMIEGSLSDEMSSGMPAWLGAAKQLAANRSLKEAMAKTYDSFKSIEEILSRDGAKLTAVSSAIATFGGPFRQFAEAEAKLRDSITALDEHRGTRPNPSAESYDKWLESAKEKAAAVLERGQELGDASEALSESVQKVAKALKSFMKGEARKIYKKNLPDVNKDVQGYLLTGQVLTFQAVQICGALTPVFWPLGIVGAAIGIISGTLQTAGVEIFSYLGTQEKEDVVKLLAASFGGEGETDETIEKTHRVFEKGEKVEELVHRTLLGLTVVSNSSEGIGSLIDVGLTPIENIMKPIGIVFSTGKLVFSFANADPKGMSGKWDDETTNVFESAVSDCYKATAERLTPDTSPDSVIHGFEDGKFDVELFGMRGKLDKSGRFEPANHQYALEAARRLAVNGGFTTLKKKVPKPAIDEKYEFDRSYGSATVKVDLESTSETIDWDYMTLELTLTAPVTISLDRFPDFPTWTESWRIKLAADTGRICLVDESDCFKHMKYMTLRSYYKSALGRDIHEEKYTQDHPYYHFVVSAKDKEEAEQYRDENDTPPSPGELVVKGVSSSVVPGDEREEIISWLKEGVGGEGARADYKKWFDENAQRGQITIDEYEPLRGSSYS